jgi:hypothetical protein
MKKLVFSILLSGFWFCLPAQILTPALNDAFLLPKKSFQITVGYSALGAAYDGESDGYLNSLDFQIGYGLSSRVNLIARYEKAWLARDLFKEPVTSFLFIGPEIQLLENRISLYLPFGTRLSRYEEGLNFELTPTINFTLPLSKRVYFNPAVELGFMFCEYCSDKPWLGIDLGLGVRPTEWMTLFAEYDLVYSFEDFGNGHYYMINGGAAFKIGRKEP